MKHEVVDGLSLPAVGLGTLRLGGQECADVVSAAIGMGYRHIDTARKYGNEESVGLGIRRGGVARTELIVTSKLDRGELAPEEVGPSIEDSLRRLETDYIDIMLIHWPNEDIPLEGTLGAMAQAREQGKIRFVGVANFPVTLFEKAVNTPGMIGNQVEYHPYLSQDRVLGAVRSHGMALTAYCPLGRGGDLLSEPVLARIAADHGRSVAQVVLRWLVEQDRVVVIPRTSSVAHLRENLDIFDFSLDEDARAAISGLEHGRRIVSPPHAPAWD